MKSEHAAPENDTAKTRYAAKGFSSRWRTARTRGNANSISAASPSSASVDEITLNLPTLVFRARVVPNGMLQSDFSASPPSSTELFDQKRRVSSFGSLARDFRWHWISDFRRRAFGVGWAPVDARLLTVATAKNRWMPHVFKAQAS